MTPEGFSEIGERLTQALLTGDFDLYARVMDLPIRIEPRGGTAYVLETPEALRQDFDLYHKAAHARGVTDIYRRVDEIRVLDGPAWEVHVLMHILAGAMLVADPFRSVMSLHPTDAGPKFLRIQSPLRHIDWTLGRAPSPGGGGG